MIGDRRARRTNGSGSDRLVHRRKEAGLEGAISQAWTGAPDVEADKPDGESSMYSGQLREPVYSD